MDIHHVHGTSVSFHDDAKHTVDFLKNMHGTDANKFLDRAKNEGIAHFIDPHTGHKFAIEHDGTNFSVKQVHHSH